MARDRHSDEAPVGMAGEMDAVMAAIRGVDRRDLQGLLQRLLAAGAVAEGLLEGARPPSRRRPRRPDVVTYRVRIDLKGTKPPVCWPRLATSCTTSTTSVMTGSTSSSLKPRSEEHTSELQSRPHLV